MSRFESVIFDECHQDSLRSFMEKCEELESMINYSICDSREKSIAITKLEEFNMWVNKALRFDQIKTDLIR